MRRPASLRRMAVLVAGLGIGAAVIACILLVTKPSFTVAFPSVRGPAASSPFERPAQTTISAFDHGSDHRLAVLVTDPDAGWLGLARGLKAHGIPFTMTTDVDRALRHKVVLVYPMISGRVLAPPAFAALARHVHEGGSVLAFDVEGGGLESLFGIAGAPAPIRDDILIWPAGGPGGEGQSRISRGGSEATVGAIAYTPTTAMVVGRYSSGSAAIVCRRASGRACALGVDLGALTERALNGRGEAIARSYVNGYEPSLDMFYNWIGDFYTQGEPMPWLISPAPTDHNFTIVLSHDLDFGPAVRAARLSADALYAAQAHGTFFMQTKYMQDFNDKPFFDKSAVDDLARIKAEGLEIASHSVAHALTFKSFPLGSGRESYPGYRPFVQSRSSTRDGTILGELRVSKFLLENQVRAHVTSFRAGYLSNPFQLPDALASSGYSFDSSITANATLSHFPFQLTYGRADAALAPVYEFPVTIEDEAPPGLMLRSAAEFEVVEQIARRHGVVVILLHPDAAGTRLAFEKQVLSRWRGRAWFASLNDLGEWWRARDQFEPDIHEETSGWRLALPKSSAHHLGIILPKARSVGASRNGSFSDGVFTVHESGVDATVTIPR